MLLTDSRSSSLPRPAHTSRSLPTLQTDDCWHRHLPRGPTVAAMSSPAQVLILDPHNEYGVLFIESTPRFSRGCRRRT
jgi:hypothetical protein